METENNPYQPPTELSRSIGSTEISQSKIVRVFIYSYSTSFAVAFTVVAIWMLVLLKTKPTGSPDVLGVIIIFFVSTLPSVFTCLCFTLCYFALARRRGDLKMWPAALFGTLSGLIFNMMTAITVIEHLFDW